MFNLGGASLSIKVSRIDSCPYYFKANLLKLALKSCGQGGSPGADLHGPGPFAGHRGALQPVNGNSWNPPAAQMPRMVDGSGWDPTAAAPILGLGEQWVTLTHPSTSEPYYWNQLTGVTQWQQPF